MPNRRGAHPTLLSGAIVLFPWLPPSPATEVPAGGGGRAPGGDGTAPGWRSPAFPAAGGTLGGGDGAAEAAVAARQGGPLTFTEWPFRAVKCPRSVEGCHINSRRPPARSEECGAQWPNVPRDKAPLLLPSTKAALSGAAGAGLGRGRNNPSTKAFRLLVTLVGAEGVGR